MDKRKRWQFYLIIAVFALTLYNILPTIFYYTKPLKSPVDAKRAEQVASNIIERVNSLEGESKEWLASFSKLLGIKPTAINLKENDPGLIEVTFKTSQDAQLFQRFLPRAGAMISFVPAELKLSSNIANDKATTVLVERNINVHLNPADSSKLFKFTTKYEQDKLSPFYQQVIEDRVLQVAETLAGPSLNGLLVTAAADGIGSAKEKEDELLLTIAREISEAQKALGKNSPILRRYYATFSQVDLPNRTTAIDKLNGKLSALKARTSTQIKFLAEENKKQEASGGLVDISKSQALTELENQLNLLNTASVALQEHAADFRAGLRPLSRAQLQELFAKSAATVTMQNSQQVLDLSGYNPFIQTVVVDWNDDKINLVPYQDVQKIRALEGATEQEAITKEKLNQLVIDDIARISRVSDEAITPNADLFAISLDVLPNSNSFLAMNLGYLAEEQAASTADKLNSSWYPRHQDLVREAYPVRNFSEFLKEKPEEQKLGLVIYAPVLEKGVPPQGFRTSSIYVIARGLDSILQKYQDAPADDTRQALVEDFNALQSILQQSGFIGYSGQAYGMAPQFSKDYIFELSDYYTNLVAATYENFQVKGSKRFAVLEFSDVEQRILTQNKIDDRIHENLLKWKEEYNSAQVDLNPLARYTVPKPTKNVYWDNFKLSFAKYFRGDDRKILKWGLDLSGGKTVRIGLRDSNGHQVTNPDDLKQAVNELYNRVNAMGVAERTIRLENNTIVLDFPGSQGLSAAELVKASSMYFHLVNEKFSTGNAALAETVNKFLQEVWNEAVVTNRKDFESINEIAWQHLGGDAELEIAAFPRSEAANNLFKNGLRLANPHDRAASSAFNDSLSSIAAWRGTDPSQWYGQTHPLVIVFNNYALEGASLTNIQVGYDPSEGNILQFAVKRSYEGANRGQGSPRDDFYAWTSHFSEEKIAGTVYDTYSQGRGWRMAVILNGEIISAPVLRAALRDAATISGRFSQREINQLAADLKAGSLSFTPRILSEQNVSPELGKEERNKGITASLLS